MHTKMRPAIQHNRNINDSIVSLPMLLAALPRLAGSSGLAGSSAGAVWTLAADLAALPLLGLSLTSSCNPRGQLSH